MHDRIDLNLQPVNQLFHLADYKLALQPVSGNANANALIVRKFTVRTVPKPKGLLRMVGYRYVKQPAENTAVFDS